MGRCIFCKKRTGFFKSSHSECIQKNVEGRSTIKQKCFSFFDKSYLAKIEELKQIADESFINDYTFYALMEIVYTQTLEKYLDDGLLSKEEEVMLNEYQAHFKLTQDQLNSRDSMSKMVRASILRKLLNGETITNRINVDFNLPFNFQKDENLIWLFMNVELFEERIKTTYQGSSNGVSIKLSKGLYYRTNSFKGHPIKTSNIEPIAKGMLALTEKHLYFSGELKNFRISYNKIITIDAFSDGIGIQKDGITSKPQIFKNIDSWFCYNFIKNV